MASPLAVDLIIPDQQGKISSSSLVVTPEYISEPAYVYTDPTKSRGGVFRHNFDWQEADGDIALYLTWVRRIRRVELNGTPISLYGLSHTQSLLAGYQPGVIPLDQTLLVAGSNTIAITDAGISKKVLPDFSIVPLKEAIDAQFWGEFFQVHLVILTIGVLCFALLLCTLVKWPEDEIIQVRALMVLFVAWCFRCFVALGLTSNWPESIRVAASYWIAYALVIAFAIYVNQLTNKHRWLSLSYVGTLLCLVIITAAQIPAGNSAVFRWSYSIESLLTYSVSAVVVFQLLHHHYRSRDPNWYTTILFLISIGAILMDALDDRYQLFVGLVELQPYAYYATPRYGLVVALGMILAMAYEQARARHSAVHTNKMLDAQLVERQNALDKSFNKRRLLERRDAAFAERERIMMDLHDGLGARLVAIDTMLTDPSVRSANIRHEVQASLQEIRLIADSLNNHGASLAQNFTSLKLRLQPLLNSAGIQNSWDIAEKLSDVDLPVEKNLHLMRIVLEAASNIVHHSKATGANFSFQRFDATKLLVKITDNGSGYSPNHQTGNGLRFMQTRADKLGATLTMSDLGEHNTEHSGTLIELLTPLPNPS